MFDFALMEEKNAKDKEERSVGGKIKEISSTVTVNKNV